MDAESTAGEGKRGLRVLVPLVGAEEIGTAGVDADLVAPGRGELGVEDGLSGSRNDARYRSCMEGGGMSRGSSEDV